MLKNQKKKNVEEILSFCFFFSFSFLKNEVWCPPFSSTTSSKWANDLNWMLKRRYLDLHDVAYTYYKLSVSLTCPLELYEFRHLMQQGVSCQKCIQDSRKHLRLRASWNSKHRLVAIVAKLSMLDVRGSLGYASCCRHVLRTYVKFLATIKDI